jgi:hypothetical protein
MAFSEAQLADAMRKILDRTWVLHGREINVGGDITQFLQVMKGSKCLAQGYDNTPRILEIAIENDQ